MLQRQNSSKLHKENRKSWGKIDTLSAHSIYLGLFTLTMLGTDISIKSGGIKLVLSFQIYTNFRIIIVSFRYFSSQFLIIINYSFFWGTCFQYLYG